MNAKKTILIAVFAALCVWTGVETYRYWEARQELAANLARQQSIQTKLAQLKNQELAAKTAPDAKP